MHKISKEQMGAIKGSIEKWDKIRKRDAIDNGRKDCPLCQLYNIGEHKGCSQCIIYLDTGERFCEGSPYKAWVDHHKQFHPISIVSRVRKYCECSECDELANAEYEFLKDLKTRCTVTWWKSCTSPIIRAIQNF